MKKLSSQGQSFAEEIASQHHLSPDTASLMIQAVARGNGSMAQFTCPELGSVQWMKGGMTMVGDMFNDRLKARVNDLCGAVSARLPKDDLFEPEDAGEGVARTGNSWWPAELGNPSSSGSQNDVRYAVFPSSRRLAIQEKGVTRIYDTADHRIGGVGQQQGGDSRVTFTSQHGKVSLGTLKLILPENPRAEETSPPPRSEGSDPLVLLEKLGALRDAGIISEDEFLQKKKEILSRI